MEPAVPTLTFYYRRGCHLCDDMRENLAAVVGEDRYRLDPVDIDADPQLKARYNVLVPVLMLGETELCHHFLDAESVKAALAGYNRHSRRCSDSD